MVHGIRDWALVRVGGWLVVAAAEYVAHVGPSASIHLLSAVSCNATQCCPVLHTTPPPPPLLQTVGASKTVQLTRGEGDHGDDCDVDSDIDCDMNPGSNW